jgi:hypothetical protein
LDSIEGEMSSESGRNASHFITCHTAKGGDRVGTCRPLIEKGFQVEACEALISLARPAGFEPATYGFVVRLKCLHHRSFMLIYLIIPI